MQLERAPVALGRLPVPAQVVVGEAEAVPGAGLPVPVAGLQLQGQRPLAVGERLVVLAELGVVPAGLVQRAGLAGEVTGRGVERLGLPHVAQRLAVAVPLLPQPAQAQVGVRLTDVVADLGAQARACS